MDMPKISVCIPTYNTARYLPEAIESVLRQDFEDYELVICDNASTDGTPEICRNYLDPRIRYVRFERLVNQGGNWNRCLELARGNYVALLHADDRYLPGFLEDRCAALEDNPRAGLAFGAVRLIDSVGRDIGYQSLGEQPFTAPAPEFFRELLFGCVISPVSPMVRRKCYEDVGLFNEERLWGIDWEMWLRLSARYGVMYSPKVSAAYRIHDSSSTAAGLLAAKNGAEDLQVLKSAFREMAERPELSRFAGLRRGALRKLGLRTLYAAGYNCERGNIHGTGENLRFVLRTDWSLLTRPTVWALWLSCHLGPWVYRTFRRLRPGLQLTSGQNDIWRHRDQNS
jgi:glycosyltransferase involved in cell wall biosynthesis